MNDFEFLARTPGYEFFWIAVMGNKPLELLRELCFAVRFWSPLLAFSSTDIIPENYIPNDIEVIHQLSPVPVCSHSCRFYMRCILTAKPEEVPSLEGFCGTYLSSDSAPIASAWVATFAQMATTAAFSAWVSVIVQEGAGSGSLQWMLRAGLDSSPCWPGL